MFQEALETREHQAKRVTKDAQERLDFQVPMDPLVWTAVTELMDQRVSLALQASELKAKRDRMVCEGNYIIIYILREWKRYKYKRL